MPQEDKLGAVKSLKNFGLHGAALERLQDATEKETSEHIVGNQPYPQRRMKVARQRGYLWKLLRLKLMGYLYTLKCIDMDIEAVVKLNLFPRAPCLTPEFKEFLKDVKESKVSDVKDCLMDRNKLLVYEYDFVEQGI